MGSVEKLNACSRPVVPAMCNASLMLTVSGRPRTSATHAAASPNTIRYICLTSVQATACTPPYIV